jgi:protein TonB
VSRVDRSIAWAAPVALAMAVAGAAPVGAEPASRGPAVMRREAAEYPGWARGSGLATGVDLRVRVGPDGRPQRVVVVPYRVERDILSRRLRASFDSAAVAAVRGWAFRPARRAGRPIAAWLRVTVPFEDPGAPAPDSARRGGP